MRVAKSCWAWERGRWVKSKMNKGKQLRWQLLWVWQVNPRFRPNSKITDTLVTHLFIQKRENRKEVQHCKYWGQRTEWGSCVIYSISSHSKAGKAWMTFGFKKTWLFRACFLTFPQTLHFLFVVSRPSGKVQGPQGLAPQDTWDPSSAVYLKTRRIRIQTKQRVFSNLPCSRGAVYWSSNCWHHMCFWRWTQLPAQNATLADNMQQKDFRVLWPGLGFLKYII